MRRSRFVLIALFIVSSLAALQPAAALPDAHASGLIVLGHVEYNRAWAPAYRTTRMSFGPYVLYGRTDMFIGTFSVGNQRYTGSVYFAGTGTGLERTTDGRGSLGISWGPEKTGLGVGSLKGACSGGGWSRRGRNLTIRMTGCRVTVNGVTGSLPALVSTVTLIPRLGRPDPLSRTHFDMIGRFSG